jgi:Cu(I)/Ag(I) efflux system membrane fusion protein
MPPTQVTEGTIETPQTIPTPKEEKSSQFKGVMVNTQKQQLIGVRTEPAIIRDLTHTIRTVGQVAVDERRLVHMHTKLEGWVQELYVKFTGEKVQKDQKLFEIYSPELVSTQEEYLLALKAVRSLGNSEFPEIAQSARSLLEATRQRFSLWDITPDHIQDLEQTGKVLRTLPLHAPSSGYVLHMAVREGMHVTPAMELYTLADLSSVWVLADVYEYEIPLVKLGQESTMTLSYFPGQTFKGKVTYVYPILEAKTRTVKVRFELPNPKWALKPGMFVNIDLHIPRGKRLVVPNTAVLDSGTEQLVFIDRGQGMFEPRKVTVGVRTRDAYEILDGIKAGEMVVTRGNFLVDSESNLKAAMEMMMPGMDMGAKEESDSTDFMPEQSR